MPPGRAYPLAEVLSWAESLLDALSYLHGQNPPIIHRDIKPQSPKLTAPGGIALIDFDLAKGHPAGATAPSPGLFGYTPQYAPIEQIQGSGTDVRSDICSATATRYESLTAVAAPDAHEPDPLRPADELNPDLPAAGERLSTRLTSRRFPRRILIATSLPQTKDVPPEGCPTKLRRWPVVLRWTPLRECSLLGSAPRSWAPGSLARPDGTRPRRGRAGGVRTRRSTRRSSSSPIARARHL